MSLSLDHQYRELYEIVCAIHGSPSGDVIKQVQELCAKLRLNSYHLEATRIETVLALKQKPAREAIPSEDLSDATAAPFASSTAPLRVIPQTRRELAIRSLVTRLDDYSAGVGERITFESVSAWLDQFDFCDQAELIESVERVFSRWYLSKQQVLEHLTTIVTSKKLSGDASLRDYWSKVNFLRIQRKGESQKEICAEFDHLLRQHAGLSMEECGSADGPYIYLDDCIFSGTHVWTDLVNWIQSSDSPPRCEVRVFSVARYSGAMSYANWRVKEEARKCSKSIQVSEWRSCLRLRNEPKSDSLPDVLHPTLLSASSEYLTTWQTDLASLGMQPKLRIVAQKRVPSSFPIAHDRRVLESAMFEAGLRIKYGLCKTLKQNHWPLGYDLPKSKLFNGFGFGAMLVTYRNCPNNCPLALWAGSPWKPLFPRRANPSFQNVGPATFDHPAV
jgi:hypothetical protein